jgi:hypothetical protein
MPCFKGIAVSIHASSAPLPEYGMQKQSRLSRISTYIPVPQPQLASESNKPEPAKFAISITLLTPGLAIPYSAPKPSDSNPCPKPQYVGGLTPGSIGERGKFAGIVSPYIPMTNSENETIAAYIYFDGRQKEEVATLLRPGEETWVNSRWVQVPDSEGGGLAEREFLFREVGLERWLNGLDLQGHDVAGKLERRRQKFERRQKRQQALLQGKTDSEDSGRKATLRYGNDDKSPLEAVDDGSDSWSSDDDEPPEATGQIKVAMFRVLASGEIKKGEYSPQFDAHDGDDEDSENKDNGNIDADVEHTTSFAKPKTLDPKTISTQTVTGIDAPDKPYAVFTFFYRGDSMSLDWPFFMTHLLTISFHRATTKAWSYAILKGPPDDPGICEAAFRPTRLFQHWTAEDGRDRGILSFPRQGVGGCSQEKSTKEEQRSPR